MFAGIHGAQRSGKSYFCVRTCIDFLRNTERDIFTNLPINPDYIAQYVCGRKLRNLDKYYEIFSRFHLFMTFKTFGEKKEFAKKNRDFWRFCRFSRSRKIRFFKKYYSDPNNVDTRDFNEKKGYKYPFPSFENWPLEYYEDGYIWPDKWIFDFWRLTKRKRTVFMFDEFYKYFSSMEQRTTKIEIRKELLTFSREHGHDNHHIYLISHKEKDLDTVIRDGFMYQHYVENQKYKNMFQNKWLRGWKYPVQFFKIESYSSGDKEPQDSYPIWPDPAIFKCYNSNSTGSTLKEINSGACKADKYDDNRGHNFIHNFQIYFKQQGYLTFIVVISILFGGYYLYKGYRKFMPKKVAVIDNSQAVKSKLQPISKNNLRVGGQDFKVIGIFPTKVIWSDNFKLSKGDVYHGLTVKKINARNESIVFALPNGSLHSVPFSGCRIAEKQKTDSKQKRSRKR